MDEIDLSAILAECEGAIEVVKDASLRSTAFEVLLRHRLSRASSPAPAPVVPPTAADRRSEERSSPAFRSAKSVREKLVVAIDVADSGSGASLAQIRAVLARYRQPAPGNLPRDVGELVKSGLVLNLGATGRDAAYGLSQAGQDAVGRLLPRGGA